MKWECLVMVLHGVFQWRVEAGRAGAAAGTAAAGRAARGPRDARNEPPHTSPSIRPTSQTRPAAHLLSQYRYLKYVLSHYFIFNITQSVKVSSVIFNYHLFSC